MNYIEFAEKIYKLVFPGNYIFFGKSEDEEDQKRFLRQVKRIVDEFVRHNSHIPWVRPLKYIHNLERVIVGLMLATRIMGEKEQSALYIVRNLFDCESKVSAISLCRKFFSSDSLLIKKGYVKVVSALKEVNRFDLTLCLNPEKFKDIPYYFEVFPEAKKINVNEGILDEVDVAVRKVPVFPVKNPEIETLILDRNVEEEVEEFFNLAERVKNGKEDSAIGLFYGPPGTGKTLTGKILSRRLGISFLRLRLQDVYYHWVGATTARLESIFNQAIEERAVLQIDEVDSIVRSRGTIHDDLDWKVTNTLLTLLEDYKWILVLTTNLVVTLDHALRRRLDYIIHFPVPSAETRKALWRYYFDKMGLTGRISGADIDAISRIPVTGGEIIRIVKRLKNRVEIRRIDRITPEMVIRTAGFSVQSNRRRVGFIA